MRKISAIMAIFLGILVLLATGFSNHTTPAEDKRMLIANFAIFLALVGAAVCALLNRVVWLLPVVWGFVVAVATALIFWTEMPMGMMDGGLVVLAALIYVLAGLVFSLHGLRKRESPVHEAF